MDGMIVKGRHEVSHYRALKAIENSIQYCGIIIYILFKMLLRSFHGAAE